MLSTWSKLMRSVSGFWQGLREWCGDAAYENYLRSGPKTVLSREQFYVEQLNQKYTRPSRCC